VISTPRASTTTAPPDHQRFREISWPRERPDREVPTPWRISDDEDPRSIENNQLDDARSRR